ncbi:MAG: hypothetical protein AAF242_16255 [Bacteroidota bacterium]
MRKEKLWILAIGILAVGAGLGFYFYNRRSNDLSINQEGIQGCIKVPKRFKPWSAFKETDWGKYAKSMEKHLEVDQTDDTRRAIVEAFFKSIDVEPRSEYVRYFKKDIRRYLEKGPLLPHWDVEQGELRCK